MTLDSSLQVVSESFRVDFVVDSEGRLLQSRFGGPEPCDPSAQAAYPASGDGWVFEPALSVVHADGNRSTDLRVVEWRADGDTTTIDLKDPEYPFWVELCYRALPHYGVIESWTVVRHDEPGPVCLECVASSAPDLGEGEFWLTQFHGDWADEARISEERLTSGIKVLDSKLGVRAHQFRAPWFLLSNDGPVREDEGTVFGGSLAWSGSFRFAFEVLPKDRLRAICGINPHASAYTLDAGERFTTPKMVWGWSDRGAGGLSRGLHRYVRDEVIRDGDRSRAILLNNWESTYFKFDERKVVSLFEGARDLGMELFLLDDGWFGAKYPRDSDTQGLGDWTTDVRKLPNGLDALTSAARDRGLRFGLWFEPEMVNPRSELFERHPEWVVQMPKRPHDLQRHQMVLDLANPEVRDFAFHVLHDTLSSNPDITFVKWDCNRYLTQPGSPHLAKERQTNLSVDYVRALYDVMERLAVFHPEVEVMMCSGGGGRVDYGAMRFAHELWPSDMTDPAKRIFIQWGYSHFYPAMALACHVTRWGKRPLKFAFDVAMSGRLGMDVDVESLTHEERGFAKSAIAAYKGIREVVQQGDLYRLESPYDGPRSALMYVQGNRAVAFVYSLGASASGALRLKGLDPDLGYAIREAGGCESCESVARGIDLLETGLTLPPMVAYESAVFELIATT